MKAMNTLPKTVHLGTFTCIIISLKINAVIISHGIGPQAESTLFLTVFPSLLTSLMLSSSAGMPLTHTPERT